MAEVSEDIPGACASVWYEGDNYGHERRLLREVKAGGDKKVWVGATPDFDVYAEEHNTSGDRGAV
eukprot:4071766-Pyramimonas_sp.AAC.1